MRLCNCDIYQLKKISEKERLICFGAGKEFFDFFEDFESLYLERNVYAIVDNNVQKIGTNIDIKGISIPVIGIESLLHIRNIVLLISCADIEGIVKQLEDYEELKQVRCMAVHFVRSETNKTYERKYNCPNCFRITDTPRIPKKIHYCWFGRKEIPEANRVWMKSWKKYCPDYEIIRWDESNYNISKNRYMYEAYQNNKWGFVSDYARLDIIYHYGGIYLDTDVEIIKSWEELRYQEAFMGMETNFRINLGLGFGSVPNYRLWHEVLKLYDDFSFEKEDGTWNQLPCPQLQNEVYRRNGFINNGKYQRLGTAIIYPPAVLSPKDLYTGEVSLTTHTYSIHHYDGSWIDDKQKKKDDERKKLYVQFKNISGEDMNGKFDRDCYFKF